MKGTIPPGNKLPKGAYYGPAGKIIFPPNPPKVKVIHA